MYAGKNHHLPLMKPCLCWASKAQWRVMQTLNSVATFMLMVSLLQPLRTSQSSTWWHASPQLSQSCGGRLLPKGRGMKGELRLKAHRYDNCMQLLMTVLCLQMQQQLQVQLCSDRSTAKKDQDGGHSAQQ